MNRITYTGHSKVIIRLCEAVNDLEQKLADLTQKADVIKDTTYTLSIDGNKLILTPSQGEPQIVELPLAGSSSGDSS